MEYADVALTTFRLFQRVAKVLDPPPDLSVSEWADRYRVLSKGLSAESGQWNTDRMPYQREIMDAISDMHVSKEVLKSSTQVV